MTPRLLAFAALAALLAGSLSEKFVFQASPTPPYGYDVDDNPGTATCPEAYGSEQCIKIYRTSWFNDDLAKTLPNEKHAYRVHFDIFAAADALTSKWRCAFSFTPGGATKAGEGDQIRTGAWGESVQVAFKETSGWDIQLIEVTSESANVLATGAEPRDSSSWRGYDFIVNSDTQAVRLVNDQGDTILSAQMQHHQGKPITQQWFTGTGDNWWYPATMYLRVGGASTAIYDQDPRPPILSNFTQDPRQVDPGASVRVSATIRDDWGTAAAVVHSWVNQHQQADLAMTHQGTSFTATLPGRTSGAVVDYSIQATATSGLTARTDTIRYTVGSNQDPTNLGGALIPGAASLASWTGIVFAILALGGIALTFLDMASHPPGKAPHAYLYSLVGIGLGLAWLAYASNKTAIDSYLSDPTTLLVIAAAVTVGLLLLMGEGEAEADPMTLNAQRREEAAAAVLIGGLVVAVLFMAGFQVTIPDLHAADLFRGAIGAVTGLAIITASLALAWNGVKHARPALIVFGVLLTLVGLPLTGVTVGLPPGLDLIAKALNLILDLLHGILHFLGVVA